MRLQGTFDLPRGSPHERHDRTSVARRTHRNGEPSFGTHEHKNHPNLRQNHRPEDKPRHGNLVAQAGGHGEEYLPSHLTTLKQNSYERRKEYYHDGRAGQYLPAERYRRNRHDRAGNPRTVRGYRPDGSSRDKGALQKRSFERARHQTPYPPAAEKLHRGLRPRNDSRPRFPCRIVRGGESPQGIAGKDYARAKRKNDSIRVGCFGRQAQQPLESMMIYQHTNMQTYQHANMQTYHYGDIYCRVYSSFQRKAEQSFPFTKAKQARGFTSAKRSSGCAVSR